MFTISGIILTAVAILSALGIISKDEKKEVRRMSPQEEQAFDLMN